MTPCYFCGWADAPRVWGDGFAVCRSCYDRQMKTVLPVGPCDRCKNRRTLFKVKNVSNARYCYPCFKAHKYKPPKYTPREVIDMFVDNGV